MNHHCPNLDVEAAHGVAEDTTRTNQDGITTTTEDAAAAAAQQWLQQVLTCPITLEPITDPVILCCTDPRQAVFGHVYDKRVLCQSLLAHPNLDPQSNIRYSAPLFYVPCWPLQKYLQGQGSYRRYDDAYFAQAYQRAWQRQRRRYHGGDDNHFRHHHARPPPPQQQQQQPLPDHLNVLVVDEVPLSHVTTTLLVLAISMTCLRLGQGWLNNDDDNDNHNYIARWTRYAWAVLTTSALYVGVHILHRRPQHDTWGTILRAEVVAMAMVAALHVHGVLFMSHYYS